MDLLLSAIALAAAIGLAWLNYVRLREARLRIKELQRKEQETKRLIYEATLEDVKKYVNPIPTRYQREDTRRRYQRYWGRLRYNRVTGRLRGITPKLVPSAIFLLILIVLIRQLRYLR